MTMRRARSAAEHRLSIAVRRLRAHRATPTREEPLRLRSTAGYQIDAHLHRPVELRDRVPGVVLCPGIDHPGTIFDSYAAPVTADEVARLGCVVLHFDPAGRGESWGEEDMGGPEHQDDVATAVRYLAARPDVDPDRVGVVSISLGVSMAVGAIALEGAPAAWLLDWEGPSDREIITSGGKIMAPALGHGLDDEVYWRPREAVRHVGKLTCGYVRLQAELDHAQPGETRHAQRMIRAAADGGVPWFQLNDHPRGEVPARPVWLQSGGLAANSAILRKVRVLMGDRRGR